MAKKLKVVTRNDLREAVDSIEGNGNAKKYLSKVIDDIEETGEAVIEHGQVKDGYAFLYYSEEGEGEPEDDEDDLEDEEDEDYDEDEDKFEEDEEDEDE
jgi:hypothetical protein